MAASLLDYDDLVPRYDDSRRLYCLNREVWDANCLERLAQLARDSARIK